ncbi:MAG TPA: 16S rRNA (cytidine(1402)-2'-O)-methyltransferase [Candidatus Omnitrophota bacterium]|nr:16S rRNA (cytidine(1402)-2'-O)-methyltransferase [Candidatus Omnitrophota bacterium]HQQ05789.1 16S rRNA (cytidine(1402)-2'-O)-methyltransferase [Candidatus Omnitrophota bacterium]
MLYIVATPIGNLKDITLRAIETLKSVDMIACEDTRHTKILLNEYGITTSTTSFFQHNRITKADVLIKMLKDGKDVALVSDAGTPGILDPGYNLINLAIENNIPMTFIPGPTAFIQALVLSGKPAHKFIFEGFLPSKPISRRNRLNELSKLDYSIIFYESCHRIVETLEDMAAVWPQKQVCVARELTKKFEEILRAPAAELASRFAASRPRGEFVVIV